MSWCRIMRSWLPARLATLLRVRFFSFACNLADYMRLTRQQAYSNCATIPFTPGFLSCLYYRLLRGPRPGSAVEEGHELFHSNRFHAIYITVHLKAPDRRKSSRRSEYPSQNSSHFDDLTNAMPPPPPQDARPSFHSPIDPSTFST